MGGAGHPTPMARLRPEENPRPLHRLLGSGHDIVLDAAAVVGDSAGVNVTDRSGLIQLGSYALDPLRHVLLCGAREVQLTPLASRLLQELAKRPGEMVERATLIDLLWRGDFLVGDPALSRLVSEIRRAAGDDARQPSLIQTVPRQGYRLVTTLQQVAAPPVAAPSWPEAWRLANRSIAILLVGLTLLILAAVLARLLR